MRILIKKIVRLLNNIYVFFFVKHVTVKKSSFYLVRIKVEESNTLLLENCEVVNSNINITGKCNQMTAKNALISGARIKISGSNNKLILEEGVKLRNATIHIRGSNCLIKIGKNTSTGELRMVNVGNNNNIEIGSDCLFADNIEIWASDTHSIYNDRNEMINPEKPIVIGDRVWVGSHVIILKGVTINDDAVIGMGSIVTKDIEKGTLNVGIPSKSIKTNIKWTLKY